MRNDQWRLFMQLRVDNPAWQNWLNECEDLDVTWVVDQRGKTATITTTLMMLERNYEIASMECTVATCVYRRLMYCASQLFPERYKQLGYLIDKEHTEVIRASVQKAWAACGDKHRNIIL